MGTDCKSAAFSFGGSNPPAPTKNSSIRTGYWSFCFVEAFLGLGGWIRTASTRRIVRRGKKPLCNSDNRCQRQKQGGAVGAAASRMRVPRKARRSRWEPRPGFLILRGSRNPPAPTKKTSVEITLVFCFIRHPEFHPQGWIRTAAEPTAACGGNREVR